MESRNLIARAQKTIEAPPAKVWAALISPEAIRKYMFGASVTSDWKQGSSIIWKGEWKGKPYEDKGEILEIIPDSRLRYTHYSPMSGKPDAPENYHNVSIDLEGKGDQTEVTLSQDNNATEEEQQHSADNWAAMLDSLKTLLESDGKEGY